jgi:hypothetical protein
LSQPQAGHIRLKIVGRSPSLEHRVMAAAQEALARQKFVTPVDVCVGLGWLHSRHVDSWRQGRAASLADLLPVSDDKLAQLLEYLQRWAETNGLKPSDTDYVAATRDRRPLHFTADADLAAESAWRTHWIPADLPAPARERIIKRQEKPPDLVVVIPIKDWDCAECQGTGDLLIMDDAGPLCLTCADMDHLVFLGAGDAALTRRAAKASGLSAVVVRWSRSRKRYERQGILVEEPALALASSSASAMRTRGYGAVSGTVIAVPARMSNGKPAWRPRSRGCFRAVRPNVPRRSLTTPACAAAAASAVPRPAVPWTSRRSPWLSSPRSVIGTPITTRC